MSFEFYGGILALHLLKDELHVPQEQAESVAEAIFRHQDLGESGKITLLGQILQLATVLGKRFFQSPSFECDFYYSSRTVIVELTMNST